jgi:Spy/CpxP family protein refolding chaperone
MVIFVTGVVTGGLLVQHVGHIRSVRPLHGGNAARQAQPPSPGGLRLDLLRRMQRELNLTPAQRERSDEIIRQGQEHIRKITEPVRPELQAEVQRVMQAFREVLTPEQQGRFDQLLKQQQHPREPRRSQPPRERPAQGAPARTNS